MMVLIPQVRCKFECTFKLHSGLNEVNLDIPAASIAAAWEAALDELQLWSERIDGVLLSVLLIEANLERVEAKGPDNSRN